MDSASKIGPKCALSKRPDDYNPSEAIILPILAISGGSGRFFEGGFFISWNFGLKLGEIVHLTYIHEISSPPGNRLTRICIAKSYI